MRLIAGIVCLLVLALLPSLEAQEKKDTTKKEVEGFGLWMTGKLKRVNSNESRDLTVEIPLEDPRKIADVANWQANELSRISRIPLNDPQRRARETVQYQQQLAQKNIMTPKDIDLRASEDCKIRSKNPPVEYDDKGKVKVWTSKELKELKGTSKLPGYSADFDRLAVGQIVTVYFPKTAKAPPKTDKTAKNKTPEFDPATKPEVMMIVVEIEAPPKR
jgi:hypothetical protein